MYRRGGSRREVSVVDVSVDELELVLYLLERVAKRSACVLGAAVELEIGDLSITVDASVNGYRSSRPMLRVERVRQRQPIANYRVDRLLAGVARQRIHHRVVICRATADYDQPEGCGSLQRVADVEVVCEGFGPVLPRMRRRVRAHVTIAPVRRRPSLVVALQRFLVVEPLVAEQRAPAFHSPVRSIRSGQ
jgi:hypothetical protein